MTRATSTSAARLEVFASTHVNVMQTHGQQELPRGHRRHGISTTRCTNHLPWERESSVLGTPDQLVRKKAVMALHTRTDRPERFACNDKVRYRGTPDPR